MKRVATAIIIMMAMAFISSVHAEENSETHEVTANVVQSIAVILEKLQVAGYIAVKKIELENGEYRAVAVNAQGEKIKLRINVKTGEIISRKKNKPRLTMLEAARKAEQAGYSNIIKIESEGDEYSIEARSNNGKKVSCDIDSNTGKISKNWFD